MPAPPPRRRSAARTAGDILKQYADLVLGLPVNHVILMGTAVNGKAENRLTTKAREGQATGEIARTKENFAYREPLSLLLVDNDGGRDTRQALFDIYPPFKDVAMLTMPSSSSAVMLNGVPAKDGGEHTYLVLRGGRHKEVLKRLLDLCAIKGLARIMISKNGCMLLRGPVDAAVWGAERVVFPGINHVVAPVERGPREPQLWRGRRARRRSLPVGDRDAGRPGGAEARHRRDEGTRAGRRPTASPRSGAATAVRETVAKRRQTQAAPKPQAEAQVKCVRRRQPHRRPGVGRARARGAGGRLRHHAERRRRGHRARDLRRSGEVRREALRRPDRGRRVWQRRRRPSSSTAGGRAVDLQPRARRD